MDALQALAGATEAVALERGSLNGVFAAGRFRTASTSTSPRSAPPASPRSASSANSPPPPSSAALDAAFNTADARRVSGYETEAERRRRLAAGRRPRPAGGAMTTLVDDLHDVQRTVGDDVRGRAADSGGAATRELGGFLGLGVLIVAVAVALAVLSARSITRPLGALADEADAVAGTRLPTVVPRIQEADPETPQPGDPDGPDRTQLPARAGRSPGWPPPCATSSTPPSASPPQQAVLRRNSTESLANLGRRNQTLLRRQLGLITALENQEIDPDAARRTLRARPSGHPHAPQRRDRCWSSPARSARPLLAGHGRRHRGGAVGVSEVEQYRRVAAVDVEACRIRGHAVAELSHLLAELIENALIFSPPTARRGLRLAGRRRVLPGRRRPWRRHDPGTWPRPTPCPPAATPS